MMSAAAGGRTTSTRGTVSSVATARVRPMARIDPMALVSENATIGNDVLIWAFTQVREGVTIGDRTSIGSHTYIDAEVSIGSDCKIQSGCLIYRGTAIADSVFVGPGAVVTNDRHPSAINPDLSKKSEADWTVTPTLIRRGASIGAGAILIAGVDVGEFAFVAAGAVVTRDVPARAKVRGVPARIYDPASGEEPPVD